MYFDEQDVVGESCGTQLDVDMMMAPLAASLPSFTVVPRPSFLMPLPGVAASRVDSPTTTTTTTGREGEEEALEKEEEESDAVSSLRKLLRRAGPNEDATAEPESPMARMALMDAESLAALSIVVPPSQQDTETASLNANAMQRLHLQTPRKDDGDDDGTHTDYESFVGETPGTAVSKKERRNGNGSNKRPRSSASSPASSSTSSSSTCASAVVLARKRALKESWRDRQMAVVPQQENSLVFDDEDDERAPRITSFVEYHVADIDDLVIAPSQDYFDDAYDAEGENEDEDQAKAEEEEEDSANQSTQQQQTCSFVDFRDLTQFNEECSEVFDDVIYAPKPVQSPPPSMMPPIREEDPRSRSHSPPLSAAAVPLKPGSAAMKKENINSQAEKDELDENCDSESSLSDGFDIPQVTKSNEAAIPKCPEPQPHAPPPPPSQPQRQCKGQWNQRRSVKRDCTFIETQCASPVFEDDEDFEDDALALSSRAGKCQRPHAVPRIEELKADYIDSSSDDFEELSMTPDDITTSTRSHNATGSPATASATRNPLRFQPRLLKKRRKARKLGLESFFRSRPCT